MKCPKCLADEQHEAQRTGDLEKCEEIEEQIAAVCRRSPTEIKDVCCCGEKWLED